MPPGCKPHDKPNSPATENRVCGPPRPRESEEDRTIIAAGCGIGPVCTLPYPPAAARRRALRPHDETSAPFLGTKTRRTEPAEFRCVHRTYALQPKAPQPSAIALRRRKRGRKPAATIRISEGGRRAPTSPRQRHRPTAGPLAHTPRSTIRPASSPACLRNRLIGFPKATVSSGREQNRTRSGRAGAGNGRKKIRVILFACSATGKSEREEASDDVHILRKKT